MTSFRAFLFRYLLPSCLYMLGVCVVWLGTKWETGLFYLFFVSSAVERKCPSWDAEAFTAYTKFGGKSRSRSPSSPPPNRDKDVARKSPLQKRKKKIEKGVGLGGGEYLMEWRHKCTIQSPYLQTNRKYKHYCIWNQVKTPGRARFRYCLGSTYIFQQNRSCLKDKQRITQTSQLLICFLMMN